MSILVCGAGPTGLMLACDLARRGLRPRIIDRLAEPSLLSKAIVVHARTLEILDDLDVAGELVARGLPLQRVRLHAGGKVIVQAGFEELDTRYPFALSVAQHDTEEVLATALRARGVEVERGVELCDVEGGADEVRVTLRHAGGREEEARFDWLCGCDGAHSAVRKRMGLDFGGEAFPEGFLLADVQAEWELPADQISVFFHATGVAACFPLPGRWRVILTAPPGEPADRSDTPELSEIEGILRERTGLPARLSDPRWLARFRIHTRQVEAYRAGRVFLCGDAAHIHSPVGGQGLNTGMQDAHNLAWKLALVESGWSSPALLDSYHAERHAVGKALLAATDLATRVGTMRHPVARAVRDTMARFMSSLEIVQERIIRSVAELDLRYRRSPIVSEKRTSFLDARLGTAAGAEGANLAAVRAFAAAPAAGDRAPDIEPLDGKRHTLLLFDGRAATDEGYERLLHIAHRVTRRFHEVVAVHIIVPAATRPEALALAESVILDPEGELEDRFGAQAECLYLVRPDLYIGYRSQPADEAGLYAYLNRIFDG